MRAIRGFAALAIASVLIASGASGADEGKVSKQKPPAKELAAPAAPAPVPERDAKPHIVRTETLSFDNWTVNCASTDQADAKPRCTAILRNADKINNVSRIVFTWLLGDQAGKLTSVISTLAGVLIGPGVSVKVGDAPVRKYEYLLCAPDHCEATVALDTGLIEDLKKAGTASVTITRIGGQSIKYDLNLKGFGQALASVTR